MTKLDVKAFALAWGVSFGAYVLLLGWTSMLGWGTGVVDMLSTLYIGYAPTFLGGIIGGVWAFVDAAIGGAIIAWIYNMAVKEKKK